MVSNVVHAQRLNTTKNRPRDPDERLRILESDKSRYEWATHVAESGRSTMRRSGGSFNTASCGAFAYLASLAGHDEAEIADFVRRVASLEGHVTGDPRASLRRYLLNANPKSSIDYLKVASAWIKAWNALQGGQEVALLRPWTPASTEFPKITPAL
jgi:hypothetical protein